MLVEPQPDIGSVDAGADARPPKVPIGSACDDDAGCLGGRCLTSWPDGYCTADGECSGAAIGEESICVATCESTEDCRDGYDCRPTGESKVCLPSPDENQRLDGEPCIEDSQCAGGTCQGAPLWPGGYCSTLGCETRTDCARGPLHPTRCFDNVREENFCVRACEGRADCRTGYLCEQIQGDGVCLPDPNQVAVTQAQIDAHPLDIECTNAQEGEHRIFYEVAAETYSYLLVPFSPDGLDIDPQYVSLPGGEIDFGGDERFQATNAYLHGFINPTMVPPTEGHLRQLQAGNHRYVLRPKGESVCHYMLTTTGPGTRLDVNIYLLGVPDLDAATAPDNADFQLVMSRFWQVLGQAGIEQGRVRFFDMSDDLATQFAVVRSDADIAEVLRSTEVPGRSLDAALSMNVVLTASFVVPNRDLLGSSEGLPGAAGLHGTRVSGIVMSLEYLGELFRTDEGFLNGDTFTGDTMAHEVGHYLGLLHTSEVTQRSFDHLDDTDECTLDFAFPEDCPDRGNLMFPLADNQEHTLSPGQAWMLQANPLTKEGE